jgi:hypothetical protein
MPLLLNDCSIEGQFAVTSDFEDALDVVMAIRAMVKRFGWDIHCNRAAAWAQVTATMTMQEAVGQLSVDRRRAVMTWLTSVGPFWTDNPEHAPDDYLECRGTVVTETAVGEAAFAAFHGLDYRLVSLTPSSWSLTPVAVEFMNESGPPVTVGVHNYWVLEDLQRALEAAGAPIKSWKTLEKRCRAEFSSLKFASDTFTPLERCPFSAAAVQRIFALLAILNRMAQCIGPDGQRTPEGQELYEKHFQGARASFTDSSDTEKRTMGNRLRFKHPDEPGLVLSCTWHGKISTQFLRLHFSWPPTVDDGVFVAYVGQKLTKQ